MLVPLLSYAQVSEDQQHLYDVWDVAIVGVVSDDFDVLDESSKKVSTSLISLLQIIVKEVPERILSFEEQYEIREALRTRALSVLYEQRDQKQSSIDTGNLEKEDGLEIWNTRRLEEKNIKQIEDRIAKIEKIENKNIPVDQRIPVVLKEQTEVLSIGSTADLSLVADKLSSQELLYFTVDPLDRFVVVTLYSYIDVFQKSERILQTVVVPSDVQQLMKSIAKTVQSAVLGVPAASLRIQVKSDEETVLEEAKILLDGDIVGFGEVYLSVIPSGLHTITVIHNDLLKNEIVKVEKKESIVRTILFDTKKEDTITVLTTPSEAKIYVNSEWVGNSPVVLSRSTVPQQLEVVQAGFKSKRYTLNYLSPEVISFTLEQTDPVSLAERLKKERDDVYLSFAIMGASLLPPLLFYSFYLNEVNSISASQSSVAPSSFVEPATRRDAFFYTTIGASALTISAIVWLSIEFFEYLKVADEYHGR